MTATQDKLERPSVNEVRNELERERYKRQYRSVMRSTVYTLITVAAAVILIATLWMPVLKIYGNSMTPTLQEGEIVISIKGPQFQTGNVVAFYYNNKILIKRVICGPGSWVDIDKDGTVYVDGERIEEPYLTEKAFGDCDLKLPYQVPDGRYFVMGDHRSTSADSRSSIVGCVSEEQIVGKIVFRIWPLRQLGTVE